MGGLATSTVSLLGDRDRVPGWGTSGAMGAAWAERGSMAGVLGLNIKFFWGRRLSSSLPFSKPPWRHRRGEPMWLKYCKRRHSWYINRYSPSIKHGPNAMFRHTNINIKIKPSDRENQFVHKTKNVTSFLLTWWSAANSQRHDLQHTCTEVLLIPKPKFAPSMPHRGKWTRKKGTALCIPEADMKAWSHQKHFLTPRQKRCCWL